MLWCRKLNTIIGRTKEAKMLPWSVFSLKSPTKYKKYLGLGYFIPMYSVSSKDADFKRVPFPEGVK